MANSILTPTAVTRAALEVLHQKLNFIGTINRAYDDSFAQTGAKIGTALKIRLPNQYTTFTGPTLTTQDTTEISTTLNVTSQKGVAMEFTSNELTMSMQDFTDRVIEPAMAILAAKMESDALTMANDIYQTTANIGSSMTMTQVLDARRRLQNSLAPPGDRYALLNTQDNADLVSNLKGLFQDSKNIAMQYKEGYMGRTGGFDFLENTLFTNNTSGTTSATSSVTVNTTITVSATTGTSSINITLTGGVGSPGTWVAGDVFTITGLNRCHPETKTDTGELQQFVVTANVAASTATSISFAPTIFMTGGRQNVVSTAINGALLVKVGNSSYVYKPSLFYHKNAFTFASADLILPKGVHFAAREVVDGLSMRLVQQYDALYDRVITRADVLYGYKTIRPELAVKCLNN